MKKLVHARRTAPRAPAPAAGWVVLLGDPPPGAVDVDGAVGLDPDEVPDGGPAMAGGEDWAEDWAGADWGWTTNQATAVPPAIRTTTLATSSAARRLVPAPGLTGGIAARLAP
ncbi:MAG: hypothetical protein ACRDYZ_03630 [Acidimicrobiales bacterium]